MTNTENNEGTNLRKARKAVGISQGKLAALAGCSQAYIAAIEGGFGHPSEAMCRRIAAALASQDSKAARQDP